MTAHNPIQRKAAVVCLCALVLLAPFFSLRASAQTTTGSIYGTVTDQSSAAIPNATVTVTNIQTREAHTTQSNGSGNYLFPVLAPGDYTVSAQYKGFTTQTQKDLRLDANQNVQASFLLEPGATSQTVTVTAATTLVDTRESQLGETIDQKRLQDLPLNGRNAYSLVQLAPGVTNYSGESAIGDDNGASFSVNGIRTSFNSFYLDGAFDSTVFRDGGNLIPNPDSLQEFRLLTSNFDSEFGRLPGGVVNLITRSGSNAYHGLAYDYLRNSVLNAKNYFLTGVTPLRQNQFGGNFGGPIFRDKAFFFLSYEGLRIRTPETVSSTLITLSPAEAVGDFSALAAAKRPMQPDGTVYSCNGVQGAICSNLLDPVAVNLLKYVPLEDPTTLRPPQQSAPANSNADQGLGRIDYQFNSQHKLSAMYFTSRGFASDPSAGGSQILDYSGNSDSDNQTNAVIDDTWILSPTKLNSLRLFYTLNHYILGNLHNSTWSDYGSPIPQGGPITTQPVIAITGFWSMGTGGSGSDNRAQQEFGAFDTFNWTHGNHNLKAGGSFMWVKYAETGAFLGSGKLGFTGSTTGNALADFLLGKANTFAQNNGVYHRTHAPDPALFVQDDWRLTHRLTLNLGVRWEAYFPFAGQNNLGTFKPNVQSTRFPTAPLGLLSSGDPGVPDGILHTQWKDFAPRVGFAFDVFGNGQTALRGAYGIFYAASQETFAGNLEQQPFALSITANKTPNLSTPYAPGPDPFPYTVNLQNPVFTAGATSAGLPADGDSSTPYVQEYNLALQQQLGAHWGAQIAYVGSGSRKAYLLRDQNAPVYSPGASTSTVGLNNRRPYQPTPKTYAFGQIGELDPAGNASYNALQATLTRRFSRGLTLSANYVWSKAMDFVSADPSNLTSLQLVDNNDINHDRGLSTLDMPQRFVASYLWSSPEIRHWGMIGKQILSGWQINGITTLATGNPFNITSGVDSNLDGNNNDRPNVVGNPVLPGGRSRAQKIAGFFNTSAFAAVPPGVPYGNARRDMLIGPGTVTQDFSAFKTFSVWKEGNLQFRGEIFNLFNNVNLNNPTSVMSSAKFGQITGSGSPRIGQLGLRYSF